MDDEAIFRQKLEGQLSKYTNVMKGWQYRWFVLDPQCGTLEYYMTEESKTQKVRGGVNLGGAVISPSEEDEQTFTVSAANGEVYRLRAQGPKERQQWVSRLRSVVEKQIGVMNIAYSGKYSSSESLGGRFSLRTPHSSQESLSATQESLQNAKGVIRAAEEKHKALVRDIESLPGSDSEITSLDPDCLLLKATSQAAMDCLEDCLTLLQKSDVLHGNRTAGDQAISQSMANISYDVRAHMPSTASNGQQIHTNNSHNAELTITVNDDLAFDNSREDPPEINPEDELPDESDNSENKIGDVEEHKSVILHLLSQLKLGMDLTRVVLPTFILEKRSLLEMYADFIGHTDQFLRISHMPTPESRMLAAVEYYLCSFHTGRKGSVAKKPYNPIIGETFNCSYLVPKSSLQPSITGPPFTPTIQSDSSTSEGMHRVRFVAEQVSHHPPVSAFYAESPEDKMYMNGWIWTKSKFLGMSVGVTMVGEGSIFLPEKGEVYKAQFPAAYGRSILTIPWMELGGKVLIQCPQTGYHSNITFHTKPFYGGKVHRISGEVKNPDKQTICQIQGEWNGVIELISNGTKKVIDTAKFPACPKRVRPICKQGSFESRRLWQHVTASLKNGDVNTATEHKKYLEERQRNEEKARNAANKAWETKLFRKEGDGWTYNNPLKLAA